MTQKVLWLGWGYPPNVTGGLDTFVGEMFERFLERDIDIELVLPAEYAPEDRENIVGVPTGDGDIITRIGRLSAEFAKRAEGKDIIHTHDWFGYGPGSRAMNNSDATWVTTYHSLSSDRNIDPPQREVETERRVVERCDELVAVSHITARKIKAEYGGESEVIHNGFSFLERSGRDIKEELGIDGKMLFYVGRHTDQKGLSHLIYALERMRRDDVTLVMGGHGHLTDQLKKFAELLGVDDQIEWAGFIEERNLGDYYGSADLFVSPSYSEPFGITITEALSVDTRVVATECGAAEILPESCVVPAEVDSGSLADAIERALAMDEPLDYDVRTWDQVVDEHLDFYERVA
jgi:glycosyltransferase involved in cell wall biosynthesis